jgi:hypothetical protein
MRAAGVLLLAAGAGLGAWFGWATPLGAAIFQLWPAFLNTFQAGVQRRLFPELWDLAILPVLEAPVWVVPVVLAVILLLIGLRRR